MRTLTNHTGSDPTARAELAVLNLALPRADADFLVRMLLARVRLERKKLRNAQGKPDRPLHPALLRRIHQVIEQNARMATWLEQELARAVPITHSAVPDKDQQGSRHCPTCTCEAFAEPQRPTNHSGARSGALYGAGRATRRPH